MAFWARQDGSSIGASALKCRLKTARAVAKAVSKTAGLSPTALTPAWLVHNTVVTQPVKPQPASLPFPPA